MKMDLCTELLKKERERLEDLKSKTIGVDKEYGQTLCKTGDEFKLKSECIGRMCTVNVKDRCDCPCMEVILHTHPVEYVKPKTIMFEGKKIKTHEIPGQKRFSPQDFRAIAHNGINNACVIAGNKLICIENAEVMREKTSGYSVVDVLLVDTSKKINTNHGTEYEWLGDAGHDKFTERAKELGVKFCEIEI